MAPESKRSPAKRAAQSRKDVLAFWERRLGTKLSMSAACEMQSNVEGVMALLAQWDRLEHAVSLRDPNDPSED
jgi:hypothetical protein